MSTPRGYAHTRLDTRALWPVIEEMASHLPDGINELARIIGRRLNEPAPRWARTLHRMRTAPSLTCWTVDRLCIGLGLHLSHFDPYYAREPHEYDADRPELGALWRERQRERRSVQKRRRA